MPHFKNNKPGIMSICRVRTSALSANVLEKAFALSKEIIPYTREIISFHGVPTLTTDTTIDNNGEISVATLSFLSSMDLTAHGYAYAVKTMSGKSFLIGHDAKEATVERTEFSGESAGNPAVFSYKVSIKDIIAPIDCII